MSLPGSDVCLLSISNGSGYGIFPREGGPLWAVGSLRGIQEKVCISLPPETRRHFYWATGGIHILRRDFAESFLMVTTSEEVPSAAGICGEQRGLEVEILSIFIGRLL